MPLHIYIFKVDFTPFRELNPLSSFSNSLSLIFAKTVYSAFILKIIHNTVIVLDKEA